jgi:hypothetical protein
MVIGMQRTPKCREPRAILCRSLFPRLAISLSLSMGYVGWLAHGHWPKVAGIRAISSAPPCQTRSPRASVAGFAPYHLEATRAGIPPNLSRKGSYGRGADLGRWRKCRGIRAISSRPCAMSLRPDADPGRPRVIGRGWRAISSRRLPPLLAPFTPPAKHFHHPLVALGR